MHASLRGLLNMAGRAMKPVRPYPEVWQAAMSLALFLVVFSWSAPLRNAAVQLDLNYRLAASGGVSLLVPPYAPGMDLLSHLGGPSSNRFLAEALSAVGFGSGSLAALIAGAVLAFVMMLAAARLLMLPKAVSHMAAWSLPLLLLGGAPFPPFGYFGLPPDIGTAIGAAASVLAVGFLYRLSEAQPNNRAVLHGAGLGAAALVAAGLTPLGAAFGLVLLIAGPALWLTAASRMAVNRIRIAFAVVMVALILLVRSSGLPLSDIIFATPVAGTGSGGLLPALLGGTPASAAAFVALLFSGIVAGAVCFAWGQGNQRAIGGIVTFGIIPLLVLLFAYGFRQPQLRTTDFRAFDAYAWPFLLLAIAVALDIAAAALARHSAGRPAPRFVRSLSFVALLAIALIALVATRYSTGIDQREAFWLNAANASAGSWRAPVGQGGFEGYTFVLARPTTSADTDVALYSAPGFRTESRLAALTTNAPLSVQAQTLANFARRSDAADGRDVQLAGLLANWGVANVARHAPDAPSPQVTAVAAPNLGGFSPSVVASNADPQQALTALAQNGFGRRDWVVSSIALPERLSAARDIRFARTGSSFRIQAEADGPALIVLPVAYDPCRMGFTAGAASGAGDAPRLALINLSQAGIFFTRKLDAAIDIGRMHLNSTACQQATSARPPSAAAASATPQLMDLALPVTLAVAAESSNGGAAAVKIVSFQAYDAADRNAPLAKHPDMIPAYAIDGDGLTFWSTGMLPKPRPIFLQLDFETEQSVDGVTLLGRNGHPTLLVAPDLVETSTDGQAWQPVPMKVTKSEYAVEVAIEPATARHLRMRVTQGQYSGNYYDQISEISVFAKDAASKTLSLSWRSPLGGIAGSKVTGYRLRWSAQPAPGSDCANCKITGIPMPSAGRFGAAETAAVSTGMLPKEAQYVSVVGIDESGKVLAVSNSIPTK